MCVIPDYYDRNNHSVRLQDCGSPVIPVASTISCGRLLIVPLATEAERVIAVAKPVGHHQVSPPIAVGVEHLYSRLAQPHSCRRRLHRTHEVESAVASVAPVTHLPVELQHRGQSVAEQIDQLEFGMAE